jgi:hypothetical protein
MDVAVAVVVVYLVGGNADVLDSKVWINKFIPPLKHLRPRHPLPYDA